MWARGLGQEYEATPAALAALRRIGDGIGSTVHPRLHTAVARAEQRVKVAIAAAATAVGAQQPIGSVDVRRDFAENVDVACLCNRWPTKRRVLCDGMLDQLMKEDALCIAEQITLRDHRMFCLLKPPEFLDQAWRFEKARIRSANIVQMIVSTTRLSRLITTAIVQPDDASERAQRIERIIEVGKHLHRLQNYNGLMSVLAGLANAAIVQLRSTMGLVKATSLEELANLQSFMAFDGSFKRYRAQLAVIDTSASATVPYLGVTLSDIVYVDMGNENVNWRGLINFRKRALTAAVIRDTLQFQNASYAFKENTEVICALENASAWSQEPLWQRALQLEPQSQPVVPSYVVPEPMSLAC
eukprot:TRINITY_DN1325_c0_g2_i1.p1 TRINITY_DN1325_c0_g2~~TRINITY_DN1325_c0_g2_i1.p1  ORF type:complete len:357 (-),score=99.65 TRINITY_DN1325_c0_g2_i1:26-1096(-)